LHSNQVRHGLSEVTGLVKFLLESTVRIPGNDLLTAARCAGHCAFKALLLLWLTQSLPAFTERPTAPSGNSWTITWRDEFNSLGRSRPDPAKWIIETGGDGWGNDELEYYTNRPRNVFVEHGNLVIVARKERYTGDDGVSRNFTSARLKTLGTFTQAYGRFEARIKIPRGEGLWPAFWMMGDDIDRAGWPACGEIDIMENIGKEPSTVHGTIHGPGYSGDKGPSAAFSLPGRRRFAHDFHLFAVEWEPQQIRFYVDDALYATRTPGDLPAGAKWVYDHPFFILLNVAVGGNWPGPPDSTTRFPQKMLVDYVRVYQRAEP
jgi:beta-glucanase (GH16 family)